MAKKEINRTITEEDKAASVRLKSEFKKYASNYNSTHDKKMTQESFGADIGLTQGAVTQYLNGHSALNIRTLLKFCSKIGCDPANIYPKLFKNISSTVSSDRDSSPTAKECNQILKQLKGEKLDNALTYLQYLLSKQEFESEDIDDQKNTISPK